MREAAVASLAGRSDGAHVLSLNDGLSCAQAGCKCRVEVRNSPSIAEVDRHAAIGFVDPADGAVDRRQHGLTTGVAVRANQVERVLVHPIG